MKIRFQIKISLLLLVIVILASCKKDDVTPELTVSTDKLSLEAEGDTSEFTITSNDSWTIMNAATNWLELSQVNGNSGSTAIEIKANENITASTRSVVLVVNSNNGQARRITVSQKPSIYPSYNTTPLPPDATGMSSNAVELAAKIKIGWNIGNTFEAPTDEQGWGSPVITEDYIKFVKQNGFNAIRIPCQWNWSHIDDRKTERINQGWLNRVKEVVGYCVKNDMYVLLNIHWDGGWLENNISELKQDSVNAKQKALWEQIATTMRHFDEHLMFASANEPNADDAAEMKILANYHQTFINAVRSTGGRNSYRVLVLQGPTTSMHLTPQLMSTLPKDPTANRLMVEVHNYTPSQFCILFEDASWGKMTYYWGKDYQSTIEKDRNFGADWDWGNEVAQLEMFRLVKEGFVDKGIPVLLGEYGAYRRNGEKVEPKDLVTHNNSVDYWITFVTKQAKINGVIPFWWDTGRALDRANLTVKDQRTIDALMEGVK
jgi:endoglucanase